MAKKRPRDPNALAKSIVDIATGQVQDQDDPNKGMVRIPPLASKLARGCAER